MSSVMVERMTGWRRTNRAPSMRLRHERFSAERACGVGTMKSRHPKRTRLEAASAR